MAKNHMKVDGVLLQKNKKWSDLKQSQRDWIYELIRVAHELFLKETKQLPRKDIKKRLVAVIVAKTNQYDIWLPPGVLELEISKYIDRLNRKNDLQTCTSEYIS